MKKSLIILILILFSCRNTSNEKSFDMAPLSDMDSKAIIPEEFDIKSNFNELSVIEEKLQDTYDLIYLIKNKNVFDASLMSGNMIVNSKLFDTITSKTASKVFDFVQIGNSKIINDSITHVHFKYSRKSEEFSGTDTLKAIIKKQKLIIDKIETTAIKIDFDRINN